MMLRSNCFKSGFLMSFLFFFFGQSNWKHFLAIIVAFYTFHNVTFAEENLDKIGPNKILSRSSTESMESLKNKFHINFRTIIRTQESRSSGAKYLNDTSIPNNHDCLIWCLETHGCNAVVFHQKAGGSCYLFDCGPPNNFHCKYTRHDLYISSILKVPQHSYDLNQWGKEVKHEKELAKLHSNVTDITNSASAASLLTTTTVEIKPSTLASHSLKEAEISRKAENKCHHYQFQCLNNSECIAIYNVCDGIPQCLDASDENELHCPIQGNDKAVPKLATSILQIVTESSIHINEKASAPSALAKPTYPTYNGRVKPPSPVPDRKEKPDWKSESKQEDGVAIEDVNVPWPDGYINADEVDKDYNKHQPGDSESIGGPFVHKHSQFVAANDPHVQSLNRWSSDYDEYPQRTGSLDQQYSAYEGNYPKQEDQYLPSQFVPDFENSKQYNGYQQADVPYWPSQGSLQDNDDLMQSSLQMLNKPSGYSVENYGNQYPMPNHHGIHSKYMDKIASAEQGRLTDSATQAKQNLQPYSPYGDAQQRSYPDYPEVRGRHYEASQHVDGNMYRKEDILRANIANKLAAERGILNHPNHLAQNSAKVAMENDKSNEEATKKKPTTQGSKVNSEVATSKVKPQTVLDFKMSVNELFQSSRIHIHETNSAILALVFGLIITALLVLLTICRVRTIRRKLSRKGRTLAHDADYLVNGMYL